LGKGKCLGVGTSSQEGRASAAGYTSGGRGRHSSAQLQTLGRVARPRHQPNATTWPQHTKNMKCLIAYYYTQIVGVNDWVRIPAGELVTLHVTTTRTAPGRDLLRSKAGMYSWLPLPPHQSQGCMPATSSFRLTFPAGNPALTLLTKTISVLLTNTKVCDYVHGSR